MALVVIFNLVDLAAADYVVTDIYYLGKDGVMGKPTALWSKVLMLNKSNKCLILSSNPRNRVSGEAFSISPCNKTGLCVCLYMKAPFVADLLDFFACQVYYIRSLFAIYLPVFNTIYSLPLGAKV